MNFFKKIKELINLNKSIQEKTKEIERLSEQIKSLSSNIEDIENTISSLKNESATAQNERDTILSETHLAQQKIIQGYREDTENASKKYEEASLALQSKLQEIEKFNERIDLEEKKVKLYQTHVKELRKINWSRRS